MKIFKSFSIGGVSFDVFYLLAAVGVIYSVSGVPSAAYASMVGIPLTTIVMTYETRLLRKRAEIREQNTVISALSTIYSGMMHSRKPLLYSLDKAIESMNPKLTPVSHMAFLETAQRMRLGQDFDEAVQLLRQSGNWPCLSPLYEFAGDYRDGIDPTVSLKGVIDDFRAKRRSESEKRISSVQRQVTVSMALGTIAPSFLIFVFVGYSIVYYSQLQYLLFAVSLLLALPCAYSVLRASIAGSDETG
ncbi:MAG: hypothetical protein KGH66_01205 [Candidatus Micrarchaeota archaeon]|nr:hypothetical protein [Candidatus Micrarchaeota archaeon]